jgi:hypothetical protein
MVRVPEHDTFPQRCLCCLNAGDTQVYRHEEATMIGRFHYAAALILLLGVTQPSTAQNTAAPVAPDPKACSDEQRLRPGDGSALHPREPSNQTLSEKLDRTEGVLCPPNVDPDIKVPTPDVGSMPIVPPPGSPGGDPTIRPK